VPTVKEPPRVKRTVTRPLASVIFAVLKGI
jgi:hypothetical protein